MAANTSHVEIGYLEKSESWKLESRFFPSKVGGKPAWLDLKNISIDLSCNQCSKPCIFLCQIYAPISTSDCSFHRMIYIFICKDPVCCKPNDNSNFKVYRCDLPQNNEFYVPEEPNDDPSWHPESSIEKFRKTCIVCGAAGPHQCGKCKIPKYCSREHQVLDWKSGHNKVCGNNEQAVSNADILFPEFEIMTEPEYMDEDEAPKVQSEKSEAERLKEFEDLITEGKGGTLQDVPSEVIEQLALSKEDKYFKSYKEKLKICPDQVLRYERGGKPLWVSKPDLNDANIPKCGICNGPRQFEFQILSTMLNYLNVDSLDKSIDWGTIVVFTCKNNCTNGSIYKEEFLYKQDVI